MQREVEQNAKPAEDARALVQKFRKHGRHEEPYADSTQDSLSHIRRRWTEFCVEADLGEPIDAIRNATAAEYKAFFQWIINNSERSSQQAQTLKQYFRLLKMLYKRNAETMVDEKVVRDVNTFIKHHAVGKKKSSPREKPVASGEDVVRMLHYLYEKDQATYPDERQRVQQGFLIIIHAFSGLRPSSSTNTGTKHAKSKNQVDVERGEEPPNETEELVKLRYRDVKIVVTADKQGRTRFAVCPTFTYFKGHQKRVQHKTFTWFDQADILTCPVAHLVSLALFDKAFGVPSLCDAKSIFSLTARHGKRLRLPWHPDILDKPILRDSSDVTSSMELSSSVASRRLATLGKNMGYRLPVTFYCFRRLVLNATDGFGSEEVRNQIAGHLESRTYRNSYQNQQIELDVPGLVLNQAAEDTVLIKQLNLMGADADPAANVPLTPETHDQIAALPDVEALRKEYSLAAAPLKRKYDSLQRAPDSDPEVRECKRKMLKFRARKEFYRSQMKSRLREEYFERKDLILIEAQLGEADAKRPFPDAVLPQIPVMPERAELASLVDSGDMRLSEMQDSRVSAVQAMAHLCSRVEFPKRSSIKSATLPSGTKADTTDESAVDVFPMRCEKLQCLFCIGDENLMLEDRMKTFKRLQGLWIHAKNHLSKLPESDVPCPHPRCKPRAITLRSVEHLLNHAQREHNIRLQSR